MSETPPKGGMGGGLVPGMYPPPDAMRPTLVGERWSVVAGHPLVAQVAADVFEAGGNAVDAGVAAGIASNVVQVDMANFGGIAPILVRPAASPVSWSIAGVGRWSHSVTLEEIRARYGGALPLEGAPAIVPGAPAAWIRALERFGTMSFAEVSQPARDLAQRGFLLDARTALSIELDGAGFQAWESSREVYRPGGRVLTEGERLVQPRLAELLELLSAAEASARGGREAGLRAAHAAFYQGDVAHRIVEWVSSHGGYLTLEDLSQFDAECEEAPRIDVRGWSVSATPTWSQGPIVLQMLGLLDRQGDSWHDIVQATTLAFNDREDFYAAPDRMEPGIGELLRPDRLDELAALMSQPALAGRPGPGAGPGDAVVSTTAVVTMDRDGGAFATSPSDTLDGGPIIPELGIICSPRGVQSRLDPAHPNRVAPGARPTITPAAVIALRGDDPWALACPGGDVIVQAMAQVIWSVLTEGLDLQVAVERPRIAAFNAPSAFHPHPSGDRLVFAEGRIPAKEREDLRRRGHTVEVWPDYEFDAGSVQTIMSHRNPAGERYLTAGADPRRSAYALSR